MKSQPPQWHDDAVKAASIQTHLEILQRIIERMASNSASSKTWCITIVSAIMVVVTEKGSAKAAVLAATPAIIFMFLDAYYLGLEKGFIGAYRTFVSKLHRGTIVPGDLYHVAPEGNVFIRSIQSLISFSVWGFYGGFLILILATHYLVLNKLI